MGFSKIIKLANKLENKYLISVSQLAESKINSASISTAPDYETEYYIYLTVDGSVHGNHFSYEDLEKYVTGARTFDDVNELGEELDYALNHKLLEEQKISEEESDSLTLVTQYLQTLPAEQQQSWLKKVNDEAEGQSRSWARERRNYW